MNKNKSELFKEIYPLIKGKDVLDVGCIEHTINSEANNPFWVHAFLKNNCNVLGIDILKNDIKLLKDKGYNMKVANAETFNLKKKFNIIFAGELIEHLSNPGLFLNQAKKHLKKNGLLIITTPNTFYIPRVADCVIKNNDDPEVNAEHTNWFSPATIKTLFKREGFDVISVKRFDAAGAIDNVKSKIKSTLNKALTREIKGSLLIIATPSKIK